MTANLISYASVTGVHVNRAWWSKDTVAVVTGANKGIGIEIVRLLAQYGLTVVLTARDPTRGQAAVDGLKAKDLKSVVFHTLDTRSSESVKELATWLKSEFGGIDILVNNAGITSTDISYKTAKDIVDTNYRGVKNVTEALLPLMRASPASARIVNVTSRRGLYKRLSSDTMKQKFKDEENCSEELVESLATKFLQDMKGGRTDEEGWPWIPRIPNQAPMYSESKIFLNAYSAALAKSLSKSQPEDHQIFVMSFCPGVTQTEEFNRRIAAGFKMPENFKIKSTEEGADTGVWLALLPKEELCEKNGKLFGERTEYPFGLEMSLW